MSVSIVSPITVVSSVRRPSSLRASRIITGLGLPTLKAFRPVADSNMATIAPQPGRRPFSVGQLGSRFVAISFAPSQIMLHGRFDLLQVEGAPLAHDHVIWIVVDDRVAVEVQRREQAAFADYEGRSLGLLTRQKAGRGDGAGEDMLFFHVDAQAAELRHHVAARPLAVVGQQAERECSSRGAVE